MVKALAARSDVLREVEVVFISVYGDFPLADQGMETSFRLNSLFVSAPVRKAVQEGRADYVPIFLSEIPELFKSGILRPDVALIHVSPPDVNGFCSLGVSVDITRSAVDSSTKIIAQVNPNMPRTWGDGMVHMSRFSAMVECNDPIHEVHSPKQGEMEKAIGMHIASLIEDGSTLQTGIGTIPDAVLSSLTGHKNLGIHTEMFSDGIIGLIEKGVVDNSRKKNHPGKSVTGFCIGSERLYGFINDHPGFAFLDIDYVNEVSVIQRNTKVVAINSCIEIDLTGQV
ncbi:MAG: acetyl-CoA hydrolase/transferase family protein, partial [Bacteroidota bacterium]